MGWGGGRELLTWQPLAYNFNVSSNLSIKVNIFFNLIANVLDLVSQIRDVVLMNVY